MRDTVVLDLHHSRVGMIAKVQRVDGSEISCPLIVNRDGSLGLKAPRGEWIVEPPPVPLEGQTALADVGEAS